MDINKMEELLETFPSEDINRYLQSITLIDLADNWDRFPEDQQMQLFLALEPERKATLLSDLSNNSQETIIKMLSEQNIKKILSEMEPDDITDVLQSVSSEIRKIVWTNLSEEARKEMVFLLRFDEDDAAGIMTPRYLTVRASKTVGQVISFIRKSASDVETIVYIYIVDQFNRLAGVCSIREILLANDDMAIKEIMNTDLITVMQNTDQEIVAKILEKNDLYAIPVIDVNHKLLGIVTVDDVIDVIREEQTEDVYKMGAMSGGIDRYLDTSVYSQVKKRVFWLILLLFLGTITTNVVSHYEKIIISAPFLFFFMQVITQTGGNSGGQSSTLMIRGLATGQLHFRDIRKVMLKEIMVGLIMGIITGAFLLLRGLILPPFIGLQNALIIALSLALVVVFSTLVGAIAPLVINRIGKDPTVMSAPLMSTFIDVCGLTIYFEVARLLL